MCHQTVNISTVFMASRIDAAVKVVGYIKKKNRFSLTTQC